MNVLDNQTKIMQKRFWMPLVKTWSWEAAVPHSKGQIHARIGLYQTRALVLVSTCRIKGPVRQRRWPTMEPTSWILKMFASTHNTDRIVNIALLTTGMSIRETILAFQTWQSFKTIPTAVSTSELPLERKPEVLLDPQSLQWETISKKGM